MSNKITIAGCVLNNLGDLLPYTTQSTKSQCEEEALERFGKETWNKLQEIGCVVKQVVILNIEDLTLDEALREVRRFYKGDQNEYH